MLTRKSYQFSSKITLTFRYVFKTRDAVVGKTGKTAVGLAPSYIYSWSIDHILEHEFFS